MGEQSSSSLHVVEQPDIISINPVMIEKINNFFMVDMFYVKMTFL
jgi:hypothetical protein